MKIKYLLLIVILSACKERGDNLKKSFKEIETIAIESQPVDIEENVSFSSMFKMVSVDNLIIVSEIRDPEYDLKIVNLNNGKVRKFAKRGKGPDEIKYRGVNFSIDYHTNQLYLIDGQYSLVYAIDSLKEGNNVPFKKFSIDKSAPRMRENIYCQNNIVGMLADEPQPGFGIYDIDSEEMSRIKIPSQDSLPKGTLNNQAFLINHPSDSLVAYFHYTSGICGILDLKNKEKIDIKSNFYWATTNKKIKSGNKTITAHNKEDERNGFIAATSDENYIYTLYSGKSMNVNSVKELTNAFLSNVVYVFDWEGRPIKKYQLDEEVRSITIDQKDNVLYAASYKNDNPQLIKFQL